ncbi:hypothetical protein O0L34_g13584 [Tuta absoluta]|nr:hypothetical protein O0L34_g13584 [Tuta absoluta]
MVLPKLKKCCFCLPLEVGGAVIVVISLLLCIAALAFCSVMLPKHSTQMNEDNIILLSMTMFSTLSAISNLVALAGIIMRRPTFLQLSMLSNAVFILCILLVCTVTVLFSPSLQENWLTENGQNNAAHITIAVLLLIAAAVYSIYHQTMVTSIYMKMKMDYGDSAIPYNV